MAFLTEEEIQSFKAITLEAKGITLSDTEAENQGSRLIRLVELLQNVPLDHLANRRISVKDLGKT